MCVFCTFSKPKKPSLWAPALSWLSKPHEWGSVRGKGSEVEPQRETRNLRHAQQGNAWAFPSSVQIMLLNCFNWATRHPRKMWKFSDIPEKSSHMECTSTVESLGAVLQSHSTKNQRERRSWQSSELKQPPAPSPNLPTSPQRFPCPAHAHSTVSRKKETPRVSWSKEIIQVFLGKEYKAY